MPSPGPRRLARRWLVAVAVLLLALGCTVAFLLLHSPGNVSHPRLSFTEPTVTTDTTPTTTTPRRPPYNFEWPRYGFDATRTRFFTPGAGLHPPFRVAWHFGGNALLEFPPVIYRHTLYFIDDLATAKALNTVTGRPLWQRHIGGLSAVSPAIGVREHLVFFPVLSTHTTSPGNGAIVALTMRGGHVAWSHPIPAGTESSPLVWDRTLYFGDQAGNVYSMNASNGHVNWTYHASGAVKGGPSLSDGILYFGDYAGRAYALNAANGHQVWAVGTSGAHFGFGSGNFYSTPAVAFDRVYMGNTDGRVYSFAAHTGQLAWATGTGGYVYASPAVADLPGLGPTVFVGSYDGHMYAFNAQSGSVRWSHAVGGRISGSATLVGGVIYFSDLDSKTTIGLDARTGAQVFSFPDGSFNNVIADPTALYVNGYNTLYQLVPRDRHRAHSVSRRTTAHRRSGAKIRPSRRKKRK